MTDPLAFGNDVAAIMHTVNEVYIQMPAFPEHDFVSFRHAPVGVTCRVTFTEVRFDLDDSANEEPVAQPTHQIHPEQLPRYPEGRAKVKRAGEFLHLRERISLSGSMNGGCVLS